MKSSTRTRRPVTSRKRKRKTATLAQKRAPAVTPPARKAPDYAKGKWAAAFERAPGERKYWLLKSEPDVFSWRDLLDSPRRTTCWDGVRNFAARNFLRDGMKRGDRALFYESSGKEPAIVGICEIVREGYPDASAWDRKSPWFDAESDPADPTWFMVDVRAVDALARAVPLSALKARKELATMAILRIGRMSVTPVTAAEWSVIMAAGSE